jgi:hypothetical protein
MYKYVYICYEKFLDFPNTRYARYLKLKNGNPVFMPSNYELKLITQ